MSDDVFLEIEMLHFVCCRLVTTMLKAMLQSQDLPTRLKVLTIANELLYDDSARQVFASKSGFMKLADVEELQLETPNMALELAAANAKILASEIYRRLSSEVQMVQMLHGSCFQLKPPSQPAGNVSWLTSLARTPERQDAQLEPLSWSRTRSAIRALDLRIRNGTASAEDAIAVLDQTYRSFEVATGSPLEPILMPMLMLFCFSFGEVLWIFWWFFELDSVLVFTCYSTAPSNRHQNVEA